MSRLRENRCRGFGEKRGRCGNSAGVRRVMAGNSLVEVPSLCPTCDRAWRENEQQIRKLEMAERVRQGGGR